MRDEPTWVPLEIIHTTHNKLLGWFGGSGGVRDQGGLESALHRPKNLWAYGSDDLFEMAAALAHGLVKNHPFVDGNKRIGFMAAYIFLGINGLEIKAPEEEVVERTLALAAGEIGEQDYRDWLEKSSQTVE